VTGALCCSVTWCPQFLHILVSPWCSRGISKQVFSKPSAALLLFFVVLLVSGFILQRLVIPAFVVGGIATRVLLRLVAIPLLTEVTQAAARWVFFHWAAPTLPASYTVILIAAPSFVLAFVGRQFTTFMDDAQASLLLAVAVAAIEVGLRFTVLPRDRLYRRCFMSVHSACGLRCCSRKPAPSGAPAASSTFTSPADGEMVDDSEMKFTPSALDVDTMRVPSLGPGVASPVRTKAPHAAPKQHAAAARAQQPAVNNSRREMISYYHYLLVDTLVEDVSILSMVPLVAFFGFPVRQGGAPLSLEAAAGRIALQWALELLTDAGPFLLYPCLRVSTPLLAPSVRYPPVSLGALQRARAQVLQAAPLGQQAHIDHHTEDVEALAGKGREQVHLLPPSGLSAHSSAQEVTDDPLAQRSGQHTASDTRVLSFTAEDSNFIEETVPSGGGKSLPVPCVQEESDDGFGQEQEGGVHDDPPSCRTIMCPPTRGTAVDMASRRLAIAHGKEVRHEAHALWGNVSRRVIRLAGAAQGATAMEAHASMTHPASSGQPSSALWRALHLSEVMASRMALAWEQRFARWLLVLTGLMLGLSVFVLRSTIDTANTCGLVSNSGQVYFDTCEVPV